MITDNFELKTPKGLVIEDCLADMHKRKNLYAYIEDGIYEWIWHVRDVISRARMSYGSLGFTETRISVFSGSHGSTAM